MIVNEPIDYMLNAHKYHTVPARHFGECDEQYKKRLKAYSLGLEKGAESRQAEIDELKSELKAINEYQELIFNELQFVNTNYELVFNKLEDIDDLSKGESIE